MKPETQRFIESTDRLLNQLNTLLAMEAPALVITNQCLLIKKNISEITRLEGDVDQLDVIG